MARRVAEGWKGHCWAPTKQFLLLGSILRGYRNQAPSAQPLGIEPAPEVLLKPDSRNVP